MKTADLYGGDLVAFQRWPGAAIEKAKVVRVDRYGGHHARHTIEIDGEEQQATSRQLVKPWQQVLPEEHPERKFEIQKQAIKQKLEAERIARAGVIADEFCNLAALSGLSIRAVHVGNMTGKEYRLQVNAEDTRQFIEVLTPILRKRLFERFQGGSTSVEESS